MNRKDFIQKLRRELAKLPAEEREAAIEYYEEYFDEVGPEGEQELLQQLGSPKRVAAQIGLRGKATGRRGTPAREKGTVRSMVGSHRSMLGACIHTSSCNAGGAGDQYLLRVHRSGYKCIRSHRRSTGMRGGKPDLRRDGAADGIFIGTVPHRRRRSSPGGDGSSGSRSGDRSESHRQGRRKICAQTQ